MLNSKVTSMAGITEELYESTFPAVASWVRMMNGTLDDAKDVFHDALVIYQEKADQGSITEISARAYIMGIVKHLWIRKYKASARLVSMDDVERNISLPADFDAHPSAVKLLRFLERAGKNCLELLRKFYFDKQSPAALAATMGYSGERSATVQKYKCIEKLRIVIKQQSMTYEDFTD
jgi:DNA-directed RNA polymerase specialized sigma24 family protein